MRLAELAREIAWRRRDYQDFGAFARSLPAREGLPNAIIIGPMRIGKSRFCDYLSKHTHYSAVNIERAAYPALSRRNLRLAGHDLARFRRRATIVLDLIRHIQSFHRSGFVYETGHLVLDAFDNNLGGGGISVEAYLDLLPWLIDELTHAGLVVVIGVSAERDLDARKRQLRIDRAKGRCWTLRRYQDEEVVEVARVSIEMCDVLRNFGRERGLPIVELDPANPSLARDHFLAVVADVASAQSSI